MSDPRAALEELRDVCRRRLAGLTAEHDGFVAASKDTNADDEHDPEGATIAFERAQVDALVRQQRDRLAAVEAALERLDAGSYGTCETCGGAIGDGRLEARPEATRCICCAR